MKAYAIKNKEGKYFDKEIRYFFAPDYTCCEHIYDTIDDAKWCIDYYGLKDCEIIEITIAEGDLEKENAVLRKALELACEETDNYWNEQKTLAKKMTLYDYFIQQAEQEMRGEKNE